MSNKKRQEEKKIEKAKSIFEKMGLGKEMQEKRKQIEEGAKLANFWKEIPTASTDLLIETFYAIDDELNAREKRKDPEFLKEIKIRGDKGKRT